MRTEATDWRSLGNWRIVRAAIVRKMHYAGPSRDRKPQPDSDVVDGCSGREAGDWRNALFGHGLAELASADGGRGRAEVARAAARGSDLSPGLRSWTGLRRLPAACGKAGRGRLEGRAAGDCAGIPVSGWDGAVPGQGRRRGGDGGNGMDAGGGRGRGGRRNEAGDPARDGEADRGRGAGSGRRSAFRARWGAR